MSRSIVSLLGIGWAFGGERKLWYAVELTRSDRKPRNCRMVSASSNAVPGDLGKCVELSSDDRKEVPYSGKSPML